MLQLVVREPNPDWLKKVLKKFPNKHTPLLVTADEANRQAAKDALKLLDRAGYACLVELRWVCQLLLNRPQVLLVASDGRHWCMGRPGCAGVGKLGR